ncbi:MAG: DedA family protein, partial [bacterium]|nr:DedA family protein [bacterium]
METLLEFLSSSIIHIIEAMGYGGIFLLMALESANLPVPSEIIMPFSGFLVFEGIFSFWQVVLWGTLGNVAGSYVSYLLGRYGGRAFVAR